MATHPTTTDDRDRLPKVQHFVSILWPSFLTASAATIIFFVVFDPAGLTLIANVEITRLGVYTIGFFAFWLLTFASSALTCYFRRPTSPCKSQGSEPGD